MIIGMMINYPPSLKEVNDRNIISNFKDNSLNRIARCVADEGLTGTDQVMSRLEDPELLRIVASLMMDNQVPDADHWNSETCKKLLDQYQHMISRRGSNWVARFKAAETSGDDELLRVLQERIIKEKQAQIRK
jgi:hypothetical protein